MALRELTKTTPCTKDKCDKNTDETRAAQFIAQGGALSADNISTDDHRLTLRIPKWLLDKVDAQRKERVGAISRNLWILEVIEKATQ